MLHRTSLLIKECGVSLETENTTVREISELFYTGAEIHLKIENMDVDEKNRH